MVGLIQFQDTYNDAALGKRSDGRHFLISTNWSDFSLIYEEMSFMT